MTHTRSMVGDDTNERLVTDERIRETINVEIHGHYSK